MSSERRGAAARAATGRSTGSPSGGVVSYRLARQRAIDDYEAGRRAANEVCDAQPELRRVAHSFGAPLGEPCPICDEGDLVTVSFAFGAGLPRAGRVLGTLAEIRKLATRGKPATCYLIEVCRRCWWNHLRESREVPGV